MPEDADLVRLEDVSPSSLALFSKIRHAGGNYEQEGEQDWADGIEMALYFVDLKDSLHLIKTVVRAVLYRSGHKRPDKRDMIVGYWSGHDSFISIR
jgi:hypothetical protein